MNNIPASIAIIGGSGIDSFPELEQLTTIDVETPWGKPSESPKQGLLAGVPVIFLPRHGVDHRLPPHKINYRANISALHQLGVKTIIGCNVVGGINPKMQPGDLVIPDQLIDYTWGRGHTFFEEAGLTGNTLQHIDFTWPFSRALNQQILAAVNSVKTPLAVNVHHPATFGVTQGPRLETAAEIRRMANDGCDIVGMTTMPEASLAAEKNIAYASVALVVNPAAGISDEPITEEGMRKVMVEGVERIKALLMAYLRRV